MLPRPYCTRRDVAEYMRFSVRRVDGMLHESKEPKEGKIRAFKTDFKVGRQAKLLLHSSDVLAILPEPKEDK